MRHTTCYTGFSFVHTGSPEVGHSFLVLLACWSYTWRWWEESVVCRLMHMYIHICWRKYDMIGWTLTVSVMKSFILVGSHESPSYVCSRPSQSPTSCTRVRLCSFILNQTTRERQARWKERRRRRRRRREESSCEKVVFSEQVLFTSDERFAIMHLFFFSPHATVLWCTAWNNVWLEKDAIIEVAWESLCCREKGEGSSTVSAPNVYIKILVPPSAKVLTYISILTIKVNVVFLVRQKSRVSCFDEFEKISNKSCI